MKNAIKYTLAASAVALLSACGGGGGGGGSSGPAASALTFNVGTALQAITASGQNATFSVTSSNSCVGSGSFAVSAPTTSTTFEGGAALSAVSMLNINYTNCTPATISNTTTNYYTSNYAPLGASGDSYLVYTGTFNVPATAKVGDVGIIGNAVRYSNSSKTTQTGTAKLSYIVEADTETTAMITVATKAYSSSNALETTQLTKYRINSSNVMTLASLTIQYANGTNVLFTRN
jgi:hypothetical protein